MSLLTGFDASAVEPSKGFDLIPAGEYVAEIIKNEEKRTQNGAGTFLALTWQISDGPLAKRQIWVNLNLDNPSAEAVNIARAELSAICRAIGVMKPDRAEDLQFKRCRIKIGHKANKQTKELQARIVKYEPLRAAAATSPAAPPWQRKAV